MGYFGGPFWAQIGSRRGQDGNKTAIKSFKNLKSRISKNVKHIVFTGFWGPKASQESPRKPQKAPKMHPKGSKACKMDLKMDPTINIFRSNFRTSFGAILGPRIAPEGDQNWDYFWNPSAPALQVRMTRQRKLNENDKTILSTRNKRKTVDLNVRLYRAL